MQKKPLISIIDDDDSVREALTGLMRSLGLTAESYTCAEDFLISAHLRRTACLIADVNMPGMSGLELHSRLLALNKAIPTILITANEAAPKQCRSERWLASSLSTHTDCNPL